MRGSDTNVNTFDPNIHRYNRLYDVSNNYLPKGMSDSIPTLMSKDMSGMHDYSMYFKRYFNKYDGVNCENNGEIINNSIVKNMLKILNDVNADSMFRLHTKRQLMEYVRTISDDDNDVNRVFQLVMQSEFMRNFDKYVTYY